MFKNHNKTLAKMLSKGMISSKTFEQVKAEINDYQESLEISKAIKKACEGCR